MSKFVRIPKRGDIAANELTTHKTVYIPREQYKAADIAGSHEVLGVVAGIIGNEALIVHPNSRTTSKFVDRLWWYCSGYTLDGALHTITFSLYFASNSWASPITKTIEYSAPTLSALISALNTAFSADADFTSQEWYADEYGGKLRLTCDNLNSYQSYSNSASGGLTMGDCMPEIEKHGYIRMKHGGNGMSSIASMTRALAYYTGDNGAYIMDGGRTSVQESVKQGYPINLPTWLGTSTKNPGDFCAPLRAIYGEGEEGWKLFMKSCFPVTPTDCGAMGGHDGKSICNPLAQITGRKMSSADSVQLVPAFSKPYNLMGNTFSKGDFWLPTTEELSVIFEGTNTDTDPLNLGLTAIGGRIIYNDANPYSCIRADAASVFIAYGYLGIFISTITITDWCTSIPVTRTIV